MAVSHVYSNAVADFTGTITGFNSQGSTVTLAATNLVRPVDWNSAHNQFYTLSGNTNLNSTASGTNVVFQGLGNLTVIGSTGTIGFSVPREVLSQFYWPPNINSTDTLAFGGASSNYVQPFLLPQDLSVSFIRFPVTLSPITTVFATGAAGYGSSFAQSNSIWANIYTQGTGANSRSLQWLTQASVTYVMQISYSGTASTHSVTYNFTVPSSFGDTTNSQLTITRASSAVNEVPTGTSDYNAWRYWDMPFATSLSAGNYWIAIQRSSTTAGGSNIGLGISGHINRQVTNVSYGYPGTAANVSNLFQPFLGFWTTNTNGTTSSSLGAAAMIAVGSNPQMVFQMLRSA